MDGSPITTVRTFNRNFMLQGSLTQRTKERKSTAKDLMVKSKRMFLKLLLRRVK